MSDIPTEEIKVGKIKEIFNEYSNKLKGILSRRKNLLSSYRTELEKTKIDKIKKELNDM